MQKMQNKQGAQGMQGDYEDEGYEDMQEDAQEDMQDAGRGTDTVLAHMTLGEVVIPRDILEDAEINAVLQEVFRAYGVDMREFTVGDRANKINPETGYPEFFFKKLFKRIAPFAGPVLGSMIPGVGTLAGAAIGGAAGGAIGGGGMKGILGGAALGALGSGLTNGFSNILGQAAGAPLSAVSGNAALQGPTLGSGIKGLFSGGGMSSLTQGAGGTGISNLARIGGSLYSGMQEDEAAKRARDAAIGAIQPYNQMGLDAQRQVASNLAAGFNPEDITKDPGYQFRLREGQNALNATLAAQGMGQSGAALRAAQEYGQDFARNEYSNAFDRWLQQNSQLGNLGAQGFSAAQGAGKVNSEYEMQKAAAKNRRISEILAGLGV